MKAVSVCYECLKRLVFQAAGMASEDEEVKQRACSKGLAVLDKYFSLDVVTIVIATRIHEVIRDVTQNPDPYRKMKDEEIAITSEWYRDVASEYSGDFRSCLKFAALGNVIDFFKPLENIQEDLAKPVEFTIDDSVQFESKLKQADKVLYLADNAGEVFFDIQFVRYMRQTSKVVYVVKAAPVQNDITIEDMKLAGVEAEFPFIITTGTATPGIDFSLASAQFIEEFNSADLIFAKGMGYYESLSELPPLGRVFHCLLAKCKPVADSLGVPLGSYVAMMR